MSESKPSRLLDYLELASEHLEKRGVASPRLDAELLLAAVLGLGRVELYTSYDRPLAAGEVDRFRELLKRRASREPVAYILGTREFWSLELEVDRRVLIPRPETEVVVETVLGHLRNARGTNGAREEDETPRALDLGTGSGAIAVALAVEMPELEVVATDISQAVLEVAPSNARKHEVADRIDFRSGDLFDALVPGERFDVIVSNPPYVTEAEYAAAPPEVRCWEPVGALVAGADGMAATRRIIDRAAEFLRPDGRIVLEVGTQAAAVAEHLDVSGWRLREKFDDLAGHVRVLSAAPPVL